MTAPRRGPEMTAAVKPDGQQESGPNIVPDEAVRNLHEAILATGASPMGALLMVVEGVGATESEPLWREWADLQSAPGNILRSLDRIAVSEPEAANAWLNAWLANHEVEVDLDLDRKTWVTSLPDGLVLAGNLWLSRSGIQKLPAGLTVKGGMSLQLTEVSEIPADIKIGGDLDLRKSKVTALPDGLKVGGSLDLENLPIDRLPDGLEVGGSLYLDGSFLVSLPAGLIVGKTLFVDICHRWDGLIPADTHVGGLVITKCFPDGVPLATWRDANPRGIEAGHA